MKLRPLLFAIALAFPQVAPAQENPAAVKAIEEYLDFTEYGSSLIWPEQIPAEDWKNVYVVDARDAAQYAKGHIPGAVNIDINAAGFAQQVAQFDKTTPILVNCHAGSRGAVASAALAKLGFKTICNLEGGLAAWEKDGHQPETPK